MYPKNVKVLLVVAATIESDSAYQSFGRWRGFSQRVAESDLKFLKTWNSFQYWRSKISWSHGQLFHWLSSRVWGWPKIISIKARYWWLLLYILYIIMKRDYDETSIYTNGSEWPFSVRRPVVRFSCHHSRLRHRPQASSSSSFGLHIGDSSLKVSPVLPHGLNGGPSSPHWWTKQKSKTMVKPTFFFWQLAWTAVDCTLHSSLRAWFTKGLHGFSGRSVASNQRLHICLIRKRPMCVSNCAANPNFVSLPWRSLSTFNRGFVQTFRAKSSSYLCKWLPRQKKKCPILKDQHGSPRAVRVKYLSAFSVSLLTARHLKSVSVHGRTCWWSWQQWAVTEASSSVRVANTSIAKATKSTTGKDSPVT